jgi:uncharacterized membrane protein
VKLLDAIVGGLCAGALAVAVAAPLTNAHADENGKVDCYGINKCKGQGKCGGEGSSCAGTNACKRKGFLEIDKETCLKIEGASLKPIVDKPAAAKKTGSS